MKRQLYTWISMFLGFPIMLLQYIFYSENLAPSATLVRATTETGLDTEHLCLINFVISQHILPAT